MYLFREKKKKRNLATPESITEIRVFTGEVIAGKLYYGFYSARRSSKCLLQSKKTLYCLTLNKKYNTKTGYDKHKKAVRDVGYFNFNNRAANCKCLKLIRLPALSRGERSRESL